MAWHRSGGMLLKSVLKAKCVLGINSLFRYASKQLLKFPSVCYKNSYTRAGGSYL